MLGETKPEMQCTEFDALLTDAIDGVLNGERLESFEAHKASCAACRTLFTEVRSGLDWLDEVEDVAPPQNLVHNILAATSASAQHSAQAMPSHSVWERLRRRVGVVLAPVLTPRFGMSMGMAFFSITLVLNMAQIRITDLTPHNLSHTFYNSQNKFMKYYENMRLVYEIESRVRDLRNANDDSEREQKNRHREKNNNQTQEQNQNNEPGQHREFSRGADDQTLAAVEKRGGNERNSESNRVSYRRQYPEMWAKQRRAI